MKFRLLFLIALASLAFSAGQTITVEQLIDFLHSSLEMRQPDAAIAKYLKTVTVTGRLSSRTINGLKAQGAGPKTIKALQELEERSPDTAPAPSAAPINSGPSASMPTAFKPPQPPAPDRQVQILDRIRKYANSYVERLPNFLCVEVIDRSMSQNGGETFHSDSRVLTKLSYFEGKEKYDVYQLNDKAVNTDLKKLGGAISNGEFGTLMKSIFEPKSDAEFHWEHWTRLTRLPGKNLAVFNYSIEKANSTYSLDYGHGAEVTVTAYKGLVYADEDTGAIFRLTIEAQKIQPDFPIQKAQTTLDYEETNIGASSYILPLKADVRIGGPENQLAKNLEQFRLYRKFGADAEIKFSDISAEPAPPDKPAEEPAVDPVMKGLPPPPPR